MKRAITILSGLSLVAILAVSTSNCGLGENVCQPTTRGVDCDGVQEDVQAVMDKHCASCHSDPPTQGAPGGFRLDVYGGEDGTASIVSRVLARSFSGTMPPPNGIALDEDALETLRRWEACQCNEQLSCLEPQRCLATDGVDVCLTPMSGTADGEGACDDDDDCERGYSCVQPDGGDKVCLKRCDPDV